MKLFRWYILPRDEVIEGLRGNVSSLQIKRNRLGARCAEMANALQKQKGQTADDQRYIDLLEAELPRATVVSIRKRLKRARTESASPASRGMSTPDSSRVSAENHRAPDGDSSDV